MNVSYWNIGHYQILFGVSNKAEVILDHCYTTPPKTLRHQEQKKSSHYLKQHSKM